jgi:hypothetical protein
MGKLEPAERALKREIQRHAARTVKVVTLATLATGAGISILIWVANRYTEPHPELWLYRTFGAAGLGVVRWGIGNALLILGIFLFGVVSRRMRVGQPAHEANMRQVLGLPPATGGPPPSRVASCCSCWFRCWSSSASITCSIGPTGSEGSAARRAFSSSSQAPAVLGSPAAPAAPADAGRRGGWPARRSRAPTPA